MTDHLSQKNENKEKYKIVFTQENLYNEFMQKSFTTDFLII
jgi:hypothetical protein